MGSVRRGVQLLGVGALAVGTAAAVNPLLFRDWYLTWGATPDEVDQPMPGDGLLSGADMFSTRAITIDAPPSAVWPWLVQMGSGRVGYRLETNDGGDVFPEFQSLEVGDLLPIGPAGPRLRVEVLEPGRALVFRSDDDQWVWALALYPDTGGTRLVSRNRVTMPHASRLTRLVNLVVMEPGSLVMERKMLLGIKESAETLAGRV